MRNIVAVVVIFVFLLHPTLVDNDLQAEGGVCSLKGPDILFDLKLEDSRVTSDLSNQ